MRAPARAVAAVALALAAVAAACALRAPRINGQGAPCNTSKQCHTSEACFLGACRGRANVIPPLAAEVRPAGDGRFGVLQRTGIDLRQSVLVDFEVAEPLNVSGIVSQDPEADAGVAALSTPVPGATVVFTGAEALIPDRVPEVRVQAGSTGEFTARLPVGDWNVAVLPPAPAALPPLRVSQVLATSAAALQLRLPAAGALARVSGSLSAGGRALAAARVVAVDASDQPLSAETSADSNGNYELALPPGPPTYYLRVGPAPESGTAPSVGPPLPTFARAGPFIGTVPVHQDFAALPASALLSGTVVDAVGLPVGGATVHVLSLAVHEWTLSRSTVTAVNGTFLLPLLAAHYKIEAAPGSARPELGLSLDQDVDLEALGASVALACRNKVRARATIRLSDGLSIGSGTQVLATRYPDLLVSSRVAQTTVTDTRGVFQITGDAGDYRLEIIPPAESALPHKVTQISLPDAPDLQELPDLFIPTPLEAVGTVHGPGTTSSAAPLVGATVEFFALDQLNGHPISLGSGLTDAYGRYRVVLPDVADPAQQLPGPSEDDEDPAH